MLKNLGRWKMVLSLNAWQEHTHKCILTFREKSSTRKVMAAGKLKVIRSSPLSKSMRWGVMGPSHVAPNGMPFLSPLSISLTFYFLSNHNNLYNSLVIIVSHVFILITLMICSQLSHMLSWGSIQFSPWGLMSTSCFTACPAATASSQMPWKCLPHCSPTWKSAKLCQRPLVKSFIVFTRCAVFLAPPSSLPLFRQFLSNLSDLPTSSIVFLDKGEKWQTWRGIIKDLPLVEGWVC